MYACTYVRIYDEYISLCILVRNGRSVGDNVNARWKQQNRLTADSHTI